MTDRQQKSRTTRRVIAYAVAACAIAVLVALGVLAYLHSPRRDLPYKDSFASGTADEWNAFGGTWGIHDGGMRNDSDERGAKLMTGSPYWRDYSVEADVKLLGEDGDAGLIIRASNVEDGVDSYSGYYAGLRTRDNSLALGRAEHGWEEGQTALVPGDVRALQWYHLKLLAYGCHIAASATWPSTGTTTAVAMLDKDCLRSGVIGLRSYSSGGEWKNVVVRPATEADLETMLAEARTSRKLASTASAPIFGAGSLPSHLAMQPPPPESSVQSISSLRLAPASGAARATIRGVVSLTSPSLYVQDSTGGVAVLPVAMPSLKVGDEVQVTGEVLAHDFSSTLQNATVHLLWARTPISPISVTTSQAATGSFAAMFIELEGYLRAKKQGPANTLVLDMDDGDQSFHAIVDEGRGELLFHKLKPNSLLRLRGICVVGPKYTRNLTPFVLLLRSTADIEVVAGPPWWSARHVIAIGFAVLLLTLIAHSIYSRAERWKLRAILQERERLAHEMHDTLAQSFAGLGFQLQAIRNRMPEDIPAVHQQLDLACNLVRHSHEEARRSIADLRPEAMGSVDLAPALERCARKMVEGGAVAIEVSKSGEARPIPQRVANALFRIGQEAIANSVRHAKPARIGISISYLEDAVRLEIEDNGAGFISGSEGAGFGLRGMRKRAAAASARFEIVSAPGRGTRVLATAPLPPRPNMNTWPGYLWKRIWGTHPHEPAGKQTYSHSDRG
jgi:signal transduction histidine kinase